MGNLSRRHFLKTSLALPFLAYSNRADAKNWVWNHSRSWDEKEVAKYSSWIENIYDFKRNGTSKQKMAKINRIFSDDEMNLLNQENFLENGNPQLSERNLNLLDSQNHCGSFPKLLFNYYSYRRGLPASITKIKMERGGDIRYSFGNHPVKIVHSASFAGDFSDWIVKGMAGEDEGYNFVSGNFRTNPFLEDTDSVPIKISRNFLIPGTMAYNANGHCLVVGKVDDSGEVHFLDSHPDRSITFNQTLSALSYVNSVDSMDGDFRTAYDGFRSLRFSKIDNEGVRYFTNEEMKKFGFSVEQYLTMAEIKSLRNLGGLEINGKKVNSFPQFVRARLQRSVEEPLSFLEIATSELGHMFRERASFIQEAWKDVLENGPIVFPNDSSSENIYQANGRWEMWSSPSSDIDRKNKYNYVATRLEEMINGFPNLSGINYSKFNSKEELVENLLKYKERLFDLEVLHYFSSSGKDFGLDLNDVEKRLFDLSFNPNHPPELRWGAPENSYERAGMKLINVPLNDGRNLNLLKSYELEKGLRFVSERQTGSTSLNPKDNPVKPPFDLIETRLKNLV
ncbi:hypothetical protein COU53_00595 [Candidatus Pacearchaeota archaeon CG10_big_fil_rev_8_21_14_0_10_30_48]|nr:MAG: hypothetical protein COU53_00595 [Candidatus Pacearchaeota archaeon CG10_big_fil_rev_8_21_14_0_10_30_48]